MLKFTKETYISLVSIYLLIPHLEVFEDRPDLGPVEKTIWLRLSTGKLIQEWDESNLKLCKLVYRFIVHVHSNFVTLFED